MQQLGFVECKPVYIFNGQHMGLFFKKTKVGDYHPTPPRQYTGSDLDGIKTHGRKLNEVFDRLKSAAVWGAGAHGQAILSFLSPDNRDKIRFYLDKDSKKLDRYIPNTKAQIIYPSAETLRQDIDAVLISAVLYENEIADELANKLGYSGQIIKIGNGVTVS
jgi:hypothetical protein